MRRLVPIALVLGSALPSSAQSGPPPVKHRVLAADASRHRLAIFGANGNIEWQTKTEGIHDLQVLDNGNVLFQPRITQVVEMTRDHRVVWSYDAGAAPGAQGRVEIHSFRRLPDGNTMVAESGPGRILELDRAGKVVHTIALRVARSDPHRDTRLVRPLRDGGYLVAHEGDGVVREYARDGSVRWEFAVPLFGKPRRPGHGVDSWGNQVFAAVRLPNGNTLISTGNGHSVLEVDRAKKIVWHLRQDDLPDIRLAWVTTVELLPNGNLLLGNCHAGPANPQILEITRQKRVVWSFRDHRQMGNSLSNSLLLDAYDDERFYRTEVQPILAANCYRCHGDRKAKVRGNLWLPARRGVLRGGTGGPIVDLVHPDHSRILRFLNHEDAEHQMPPKRKLGAADLAVLTEWVRRGVPMTVVDDEWLYQPPSLLTAAAKQHWSFQAVGEQAPPQVAATEWCRNEIDRFVLQRIVAAGLQPNRETDRVSLLRRVSYSLTGLPPSSQEIAAFLADRSPDAYEKVVDRLLASPHYGEHQARHWLDLVRFAETNGYERDSAKPQVWKYRQYVIDSFNRNKSYDRFLTEQLAGDELDDANTESITGTGFLRLGLWDDEPSDRLQAEFDGFDDIVRTTGEVFLGLTIGCARCHDHKLDPIPQRDYYSMLAFFRNLRPYSQNPEHVLTDVSTAEQRRELERQNQTVRTRRVEITERLRQLRNEFAALLAKERGDSVHASDLSELEFAFYRESWSRLPDFDAFRPETRGKVPSNLFDIDLATRGTHFGFVFRGKAFVPKAGSYTFSVDADDGVRLRVDGWNVVTYDGIHGLGNPRQGSVELTKGHHEVQLEYFQGTGGKGLEVAWSGPDLPRRLLSRRSAGDGRELEQQLRQHGRRLLGAVRHREYRSLRRELSRLAERRHDHLVLSAREPGPVAPATHVLTRGSAHAPAARVEPRFLQVLGGEAPQIEPRNRTSGRRRALAAWLTRKDHPLTARVMVNRVWQFVFGRGLVRTSSDFGMTGSRPTHPQLLDWLARRFVAEGWDIKKLHRRLVLSSTFRLSCAGSPRALERDPTNDLLWRFDMRRLSAEELRDAVLLASGQLDLAVGGKSVFPEIPAEVLAGQSRVTWHGDSSRANNSRRSLYTFVKRSLLDPFVESFDAATTDTSCAVRFQTTQPTQALTLLNSAFINKAARALAERVRADAGDEPRAQVTRALSWTTGRQPSKAQVDAGVAFMTGFPAPSSPDQPLQQMCLIALNLNAFLFLD
ncbi:MAG: DUF1553 domain-containing protein [Planctomycetes bacterium]|nr:DUF1553 domain-containing protein [Planctomycetota bacterium]